MDGTATHMECVSFNTQQYIKSGGLLEGTSYRAYLALELGLVPTLFRPSPRERDLGRPSPGTSHKRSCQNLNQKINSPKLTFPRRTLVIGKRVGFVSAHRAPSAVQDQLVGSHEHSVFRSTAEITYALDAPVVLTWNQKVNKIRTKRQDPTFGSVKLHTDPRSGGELGAADVGDDA
jgi:hypothetical protein